MQQDQKVAWHFWILFTFGVSVVVFNPTISWATWELAPSANLGTAYNHREGQDRIWEAHLSPSLALRWTGPYGQYGLNYGVSLRKDLEQGDSSLRVAGDHRLSTGHRSEWTPRFHTDIRAALAVSPDLTRAGSDSSLSDTGEILIPATDVLHWNANLSMGYKTSLLGQAGLGLSYALTHYKEDRTQSGIPLHDAASYSAALSQSQRFTRNSSGQVSYRYTGSTLDDLGTHGLSLGYHHTLLATLSAGLNAGVSYLPSRHDVMQVYGVSLSQGFSDGGLSFSAGRTTGEGEGLAPPTRPDRDAPPGSDASTFRGRLLGGGFFTSRTETDYVSLSGRLKMTRNLDGSLQGGASRNRQITDRDAQVRAYTATAGLHYRVSAHWSGNVTYQYQRQRTELAALLAPGVAIKGEDEVDSKRISAFLSWRGDPWR